MNWKKHIIIFLVVFFLGAFVFGRGGCTPGGGGRPEDATVVELTVPGSPEAEYRSEYSYTIRAEVADTAAKRQKGLSGRRGLEPGYGMLYVYDEPRQPDLTQANTPFPLSVAFLKTDGEIVGIRQTEPNDEAVYSPPEPVSYILEVRRGWFEDRGIAEGDRLSIPPIPRAGEPPAQTDTPMFTAPVDTEMLTAPVDTPSR
ncbi:MAG: DUF192 domain-containing protein [Candidatus Brocadiia bacterium]